MRVNLGVKRMDRTGISLHDAIDDSSIISIISFYKKLTLFFNMGTLLNNFMLPDENETTDHPTESEISKK
jgi:hypothetical protein